MAACGGQIEETFTADTSVKTAAEFIEPAAEDFEYQYDAALRGVKITKYLGDAEAIRIPSAIGGDPVKHIRLSGSGMTRVEIPYGVTEIGQYAFFSCEELTSVIIPDSVEYIGSQAFFCCTELTETDIPDSVTVIGNDAFFGCTKLRTLTLPDGIVHIGNCFDGCVALTVTYKGHEYIYTDFDELYNTVNRR